MHMWELELLGSLGAGKHDQWPNNGIPEAFVF